MSLKRYHSLLDAYGCAAMAGGQPVTVLIGMQRIHLHFVADEEDPSEDLLMARTDVLHLPRAPSVQVCRSLLQANAFWAGIQGGALGLRGTQTVMLSVSQRLALLDAGRLAVLLQQMAEDARRWAVFLQVPDTAQPQASILPGVLA